MKTILYVHYDFRGRSADLRKTESLVLILVVAHLQISLVRSPMAFHETVALPGSSHAHTSSDSDGDAE